MKLIKRVIISENIIKYHNIDGNIAFLTDCDINKKGSLESLLDSRKRVADENICRLSSI